MPQFLGQTSGRKERLRAFEGDRDDPVERVQRFEQGRYQTGIEGSGAVLRPFVVVASESENGDRLTVVDDSKLANKSRLRPQVLESRIEADLIPRREGSARAETPRTIDPGLGLAPFAQLKPVCPKKFRGHDVIEIFADERKVVRLAESEMPGLGGI